MDQFSERLRSIIPEGQWDAVLKTFSAPKPFSIRINTLKAGLKDIFEQLEKHKIVVQPMIWCPYAALLEPAANIEEWTSQGFIYAQGLSSLLPVIALDPQPEEKILDMCAAPGSKTSQIAALMNNTGEIICVENIKDRYYRLRSVLDLLGVKNVRIKLMDARKFRGEGGSFASAQRFDRVLVDVPCSSEGKFKTFDKKTFQYWSPRKIREMVRKQRGILLNATRFLKEGGTLIYSTCTFAPEENEGIVDWVLRKTDGAFKTVPIDLPGIAQYPAKTGWLNRTFNEEVKKCFRVLPTEDMEGFFIAKLVKGG